MEKARFIEFRRYFNQEMLTFVDGESKIEELHHNMMLSYPELDENYKLPELYLRADANVDEVMDEEMEEDVQPKPKKKPKDFVAIEKKLRDSLNEERFLDYVDETHKLRMENENYCIETLRYLDKAESDARKRIVYFSALKGQVLKRLKEITGKKIRSFLEMTNYKQSHAYFLINLYDLIQEYNKLMYSDASLCFFKNNIKEIKIICQKDEMFFKSEDFPMHRKKNANFICEINHQTIYVCVLIISYCQPLARGCCRNARGVRSVTSFFSLMVLNSVSPMILCHICAWQGLVGFSFLCALFVDTHTHAK